MAACPLSTARARGIAERAAGFSELAIGGADAETPSALDWDNRDPFDRVLVAHCLNRDLALVTADARFRARNNIAVVRARLRSKLASRHPRGRNVCAHLEARAPPTDRAAPATSARSEKRTWSRVTILFDPPNSSSQRHEPTDRQLLAEPARGS
jgi:hypothetical protein